MAEINTAFGADYGKYQKHYSETGFWEKLKCYGKRLGAEGVKHALVLYYSLQDPTVPSWAKAVILGALGYLIFPVDAVPDFIPVFGLADDWAVLAAAIAGLELNIPQSAMEKAEATLKDWLGH